MDPNANLKRQRELAKLLLSDREFTKNSAEEDDNAARELAEHVQALDEWLAKGGFLPRAWMKGHTTCAHGIIMDRCRDCDDMEP